MKPLNQETLTADRRAARVDRLALASVPDLWSRLVDLYGRPTFKVMDLNPERNAKDFPRLATLRWVGGSRWADLGSGANGDGVISLVEWLSGGAPRERCVAFLEQQIADLAVDAA